MSRIKKEQAEIEKKYILEELKKGTKQVDIAKSLGKSSAYISNMKKRLIEEKLLEEVTDGRKEKQIRIQEKGQDDVKELIKLIKIAKMEGNWEEVKKLQLRMLEIDPNNVKALADLVVIAKREENWEEVKRIQLRRLAINPNDVKALSDLVAIAKREGNWVEVKRLQLRGLEINPNNVVSIIDLITIAKREKNWEEVKRLQLRVLKTNPNDVKAISDLITIARKEEDWEEVKRLQLRVLEIEPNNLRAISELASIARREEDWLEVERLEAKKAEIERGRMLKSNDSRQEETKTEIDTAKNMISQLRMKLYAGEIDFSQINEIANECKDSTAGVIFVAEMCIYFGQKELAMRALKAYQKNNELTEKEKKAIKLAMVVAKQKTKVKGDMDKWDATYGVQGER